MFPFALSLIGIAVIALGLLYHKRQAAIAALDRGQHPGDAAEAAARARAVIPHHSQPY